MKPPKLTLLALSLAAVYGLAACGGDDDHAHDGDHDHDEQAHHDNDGDDHDDGHDDPEGHDEDGDDHAGHDGEDHEHANTVAGPNGGRVLTSIEPHAEFFVTDERKVQISFVNDDIKTIPAAEQSVTVIAGDRTSPTRLKFAKTGDVLLSDVVLPEGNDFPVIVQIKTTPSAKAVVEKFNLNMKDCPTCDFKEYACICEHDHDE